jgi:putative two-component system hydrogenase maturation factor HypX/HoxX
MALDWNEKYKIGDGKIDAEHQEWFRLAKEFLTAGNLQSMHRSGEAFSQFTRHHFFDEEILMRDIQYPFTATHTREHQGLVSTLNKILDVLEEDVLSKNELEDFVNYCLVKHICTDDSQLAVYVRRHSPVSMM